MNTLKVWLEKYGSAPEEARWPSEHYLIQVEVLPWRCAHIKACWLCGCHGLQVSLQSVPSLGLLSMASMSSSSLLLSSDEESVLASSSKAGIDAQAYTFKANVKLEVMAGDPNDIGLSEQ